MTGVTYTIHRDREITLEVARLLGVAFTWGGCGRACRYVPTSGGFTIEERALAGWVWEWHPATLYTSEAAIKASTKRVRKIYLVTFSDEAPLCEE